MISNVLGLLIGAEFDRGKRGEGIPGALESTLIGGAVKTIAPLIDTCPIGRSDQFHAHRAFDAITGYTMRGPHTL